MNSSKPIFLSEFSFTAITAQFYDCQYGYCRNYSLHTFERFSSLLIAISPIISFQTRQQNVLLFQNCQHNVCVSCFNVSSTISSLLNKTSKFEWTLDNTRIEEIISAPIRATIFLFFIFYLSILFYFFFYFIIFFFWGFSSTRR